MISEVFHNFLQNYLFHPRNPISVRTNPKPFIGKIILDK